MAQTETLFHDPVAGGSWNQWKECKALAQYPVAGTQESSSVQTLFYFSPPSTSLRKTSHSTERELVTGKGRRCGSRTVKGMHREVRLSGGQKAGARQTEMSEVGRGNSQEMWMPTTDVPSTSKKRVFML